jgi:phosphohistidine phosphatase
MRHGEAVDRDSPSSPPDAKRPLTDKGRARARQVAEGMRRLGVAPALVLTSAYVRARQTAEIAGAVLVPGKAALKETAALIPGAEPGRLLSELRGIRADEVLCVGHLPHLDLALAALLGLSTPITSLKKAGVACVDWNGRGGGTLLWLATPRLLRKIEN